MNWSKYITREETIAGLEISEGYLRLALLEINQKTGKTELRKFLERPLEEGAVKNGLVGDKAKLVSALKDLLKSGGAGGGKVNYAIATIPANSIYLHTFPFPKTVSGQKLEESIKLTIGFQLPIPPDSVYLDWEKIESDSTNDILLVTSPKNVINEYTDALKSAGIRTIAVEVAPLSASRVLELPKNKPLLTLISSQSGTEVTFLEKGKPRFARFLMADKISGGEALSKEVRRLIDYYEADRKTEIGGVVHVGEAVALPAEGLGAKIIAPSIKQELLLNQKIQEDPGRYLAVMGAAMRGILARSEDGLVSLMPVGTEEAYENNKAVAFAGFLSTITMTVAVFFLIVYLSVWVFLNSSLQAAGRQLQFSQSLPLPADASSLEARATALNDLTAKTVASARSIQKWSGLVEALHALVTPGIKIISLNIPSSGDLLTISGVADSRVQLNSFKKSLEDSAWFTGVIMPPANPAQKENISFTASFRIKDMSLIGLGT